MEWGLIRVLFPIVLAFVGCWSPPKEIHPHRQVPVMNALAGQTTKADLSSFIGVPPIRCVTSSATSELCQWEAGGRQRGWQILARAIETGDWINVVCNVLIDEKPRRGDSCSVYPRRSNRGSWISPHSASQNKKSPFLGVEERRKLAEQADQIISKAETILELSHMMGSVPDYCTATSPGEQVCGWHATNRTFGQGTVATWIGVPMRKKVRFFCTLPTDGGKRRAGSCSAEIGG